MSRVLHLYQTSDGQQFESYADAAEYQDNLNTSSGQKLKDSLAKFKTTYSYNQMMRTNNLSDEGLWEVRGEDPNCDFGGPHHEPLIGRVDGRLDKVIEWAVMQPMFWHWGAGGRIISIKDVIKV